MFGLFGEKKEKDPKEQVKSCLQKHDLAGLAKAYYHMGVQAMDQGDLNHAVLWLNRADTIYSAQDEVYDKVGDKVIDDCSERIGTLEDAALLYNDVPGEIMEKAEELSDVQVRLWDLFAIARLVRLGERFARQPGCEVLGQLGHVVDIMFQSLRQPITQEEYGYLMDVCNALYEWGDSEVFFGENEIEVPGGAPFQVFDLNGMLGVLQINEYIDSHLRLLSALSQGAQIPASESHMTGCTLLLDYYVRTTDKKPEDIPQIKAELARIWSDYQLVSSNPDWEVLQQKLEEYKAMEILTA